MTLGSFLIKRFAYTIIFVFFVILLNWVIVEAMLGLTGNLYSPSGREGRLGASQYNASNRTCLLREC